MVAVRVGVETVEEATEVVAMEAAATVVARAAAAAAGLLVAVDHHDCHSLRNPSPSCKR